MSPFTSQVHTISACCAGQCGDLFPSFNLGKRVYGRNHSFNPHIFMYQLQCSIRQRTEWVQRFLLSSRHGNLLLSFGKMTFTLNDASVLTIITWTGERELVICQHCAVLHSSWLIPALFCVTELFFFSSEWQFLNIGLLFLHHLSLGIRSQMRQLMKPALEVRGLLYSGKHLPDPFRAPNSSPGCSECMALGIPPVNGGA